MENIHIIEVIPEDIDRLQKISIQTFSEAYSTSNSEGDMKKYMEESFSKEKLLSEIDNPDSRFYFAVSRNEVIGYLKLNFGHAQTDLKDGYSLEIERIYVLQEFHGKDVGQLLYEKALHIARQMKFNYIWLGVWEKNLKAIRFYKKNGFVEFDKHIFKLGEDEQTDIMMKFIL